MTDYTERMAELRERAHRIFEVAKDDPEVPPARLQELRLGIDLIEMGWQTVRDHPDPAALAEQTGTDLDAKIEEWESNFAERERELGIR